MMGKEFFGKLLSNRQDKPEPRDRNDPEDGLAAVDLDDAPAPSEEEDARRAAGGDGQTSTLPEIEPPHASSVDARSDSDEPRSHVDQPEEQTEPSPPSNETSGTHSDDTSVTTEVRETDRVPDLPEHPSQHDYDEPHRDELHHDGPHHDEHHQDEQHHHELHADELHADELHADDPHADGLHVDGLHADELHDAFDAVVSAGPAPNDTGSESETSSTAPELEHDHNLDHDDVPSPSASAQNGTGTDRAPVREHMDSIHGGDGAAEDPNHAGDHAASLRERMENASPESENPISSTSVTNEVGASTAGASESVAQDESAAQVNSGPSPQATDPESAASGPAAEDRRPADTPAASRPASSESRPKEEPAAPPHREQQPQTGTRKEGAGRTRDRERKGADPTRARPKAPASIQGDAELRGIKDRVVIRLLEKQLVSPTHVKAAMGERNKGNLKATLWRIVAHQKGVDREAIYREAALTYAFVERKLEDNDVDLEFVRQVADVFPEKRRNRLIELRVVPVGYEFEQQTQMLRVVFLTHDPSLPAVRELMQELNLERYELQYAPESAVKDLLAKAFPRKNEYLERMSEDPLAYDLGLSYEDEKGEMIDEEALEAEINRSSLINLFEAALVESVLKGASDIHIYPNAKRQVEIHFRIDGRLVLWHIEDKVHPESLLAVIKDNTMNVDRFERDMAQDGFIQRKVDDTLIRYRVSILPIATAQQSLHAESIVIRVLDDRKVITDLAQLGLLKGALDRFDMAIRQPHGMVILTGPTGSGKSTTLVAALHQVVNPEINVLTVEDPVEYIIPGVRQIKLNHKLNLEQALRSILRHDPDVVMVGEMRDRPTAELAIKLANTGHLTFSTLHTNDAPSAVSRLYKMGVEPFLIAYAINLVVAQRLIRSLCPSCKVVDSDPDPILLDRLGFTKEDLATTTLYKPSGDPTCKHCKGTGYKGRRAISEALYFSRAIRHMIVEADNKIDEDSLREAARKDGMLTLQDSAREVAKMGVTSIDEMMRVTTVEE